MDKPLVTVIVPAYNASDYIAETLESILSQTYNNLQIIVVDDGSTDSTANIIKSYHPEITYLHQKNSGNCASPRNNGLKHAKGEFVTFFDADDIMLPTKIAQQVEDLLGHQDAVACVANYRNFSEKERAEDHFSTCPTLTNLLEKSTEKVLRLTPEECRDILIEENFTIASSPLYRIQAVATLGGFDQSLTACEDFHLIYRVAMEGCVVVDPSVGFERRLHDLNMSGDDERMLRNFVLSRSKLLNLEPKPELRIRLQQRVSWAKRSLQSCLVRKGSLKEALRIYHDTFPPRSYLEAKADLKQAVKMALIKTSLLRINTSSS